MRTYAFPQLDREDDALCPALCLDYDAASRTNRNSVSRKDMRKLLADRDLQVVGILRELLGEDRDD